MSRLLGLVPLLAGLPAPLLAAELPGNDLTAQALQLTFGLLLVLGLIFALAWGVRRLQQATPAGGKVIRLLASQALGPRERLLLVQVGNEQLLLGLTAGRITPLHVLREPLPCEDAAVPATPEFARQLMELLGKGNREPRP